jgi:hypothetical protein
MLRHAMLRALLALVLLASCDRRPTSAPAVPAQAAAGTRSEATASEAGALPSSTSSEPGASRTAAALASSGAEPPVARGIPCGALSCLQFDSPRDALLAALAARATGATAGDEPRVVALGEAHAPKGATAPSAARRFTEELLPLFAGRASDLLVELMMPPQGCADAAAEVRQKQAPATSKQAPTNQNEYLTMGERARALGIVPDMLRPSCADLDGVRDAGDGAIEASLAMIARLSTAQAEKLLDRDARSDADRSKRVVVYGGMLHNDLDPPPERAKWSYAPALSAKTGGKIVSVDLIVPEYIVDDATWRGLAWFPHYDRARLGTRTTLFRLSERSFVLVFAETPR